MIPTVLSWIKKGGIFPVFVVGARLKVTIIRVTVHELYTSYIKKAKR
jgi:hypothetical protein